MLKSASDRDFARALIHSARRLSLEFLQRRFTILRFRRQQIPTVFGPGIPHWLLDYTTTPNLSDLPAPR